MGKVLNIFNKYIDGSVCCALEEEEGVGCLRDCPYSRNGYETSTCRKELQKDGEALRQVIAALENLLEAYREDQRD